jgi:hypothetical protein
MNGINRFIFLRRCSSVVRYKEKELWVNETHGLEERTRRKWQFGFRKMKTEGKMVEQLHSVDTSRLVVSPKREKKIDAKRLQP